LNDTGDQVTGTEADTLVQAPATVNTPEPENKRNGEGWMRKGVLAGAIAALVVVVAAGFFTIGWFTSTRGEDRWQQNMSNERMNMHGWGNRSLPGRSQRGFDNQGGNQSQGSSGSGSGTVVPQQGQNGRQQSGSQAQTVPQSQSGSQQSNPSSQSYGPGQQAPGAGGQQSTPDNQPAPSTPPSSTAPATPN
jgi:hypothetical protein